MIGQEPVHQVHHRGDGLLLVFVSAVRADGSGRDPVAPGRITAGFHEVSDGLHDGMRHRGVADGRQFLQHGQGVVGELSEISRRGVWGSSRKLLTGLEYVPRVLITDKLRSYSAARHRVLRLVEHRQSKYLNNRAENSHQPTRQRERAMKKFTSARHAQRFLSAFSGISPHFRPGRHRLSAQEYRREMTD